jgi:hypothetical protein
MENTDAKETLRFAIFSGIVDTWYLQDPQKTRDAILEKILEPHLKWAVEELTGKKELQEIIDTLENDNNAIPEWLWKRIEAVKTPMR